MRAAVGWPSRERRTAAGDDRQIQVHYRVVTAQHAGAQYGPIRPANGEGDQLHAALLLSRAVE